MIRSNPAPCANRAAASCEVVTHEKEGGLLMFSSLYSFWIWTSICPSSSSM
ncbi:MAG: hypothetical protein WC173_07040 [Bacteroidales bacterium]